MFIVLLWRGFVREPPQGPGGSGARRCGVLGISHLKVNQRLAPEWINSWTTYPRAKIGVSGKLQDVCKRRSSRGLCADRLGNPLLMRRLRDDVLDGKSGGRVRPGDLGDDIGIDPFLYDLLKPASIERVFRVFNDGAWGGIAGARCSFL